jgi:hypothetical protein
MVVARRGAWNEEDELPPRVVDLQAPASKNDAFALRMYLVDEFGWVLRARRQRERWDVARRLVLCPGLFPIRFKNPAVRRRLAAETDRSRVAWNAHLVEGCRLSAGRVLVPIRGPVLIRERECPKLV